MTALGPRLAIVRGRFTEGLTQMSHCKAGTRVLGTAATLLAIVATLLRAGESASRGSEVDPSVPTPVEYSLSDDTTSFDIPGAYVSSSLSDLLDDEQAGPCPDCGPGAKCDCKKSKDLKKKVAGAYGETSYLNTFDYLCDPCYSGSNLGEVLKRRGIGDSVTLDVGGQFRMRQHAERNMRGLGLTGRDDDFLLYRTRLYTNLEVGDSFRILCRRD